MASNIADLADPSENFARYTVWKANEQIAVALNGDPSSVQGLTSVLHQGFTKGPVNRRFRDVLYAIALDCIYLRVLFYDGDPARSVESTLRTAYQQLKADVPINFAELRNQEFCSLFIFELAPALDLDVKEISANFLHMKVLALQNRHKDALDLLAHGVRKTFEVHPAALVAVNLAEPFLLASRGDFKEAELKAARVDISCLEDEAARSHMESVKELFRGRPENLTVKLRMQSERGRNLLGFVMRADCSILLGGTPAARTRRNYLEAALHGFSCSSFNGAALLMDHLKELKEECEAA